MKYSTRTLDTPTGFTFIIKEHGRQLNSTKVFSGQSRVETLTDVKYVDANTVVVGHRDQKLLYLIRIDRARKQAMVLDRLLLDYQGAPKNVTLFCVEGITIYMTFLTRLIGVAEIHNNRLVKKGLMLMGDPVQEYHGIHKVDNTLYLAGAMITPKLVVHDMLSNQSQVVQLPGLEGVNIKQTQLMGDYLVISGAKGHISDTDPNCSYSGYVGVYNKDSFECVDLVELPTSQMDDIRVDGGRIFCIRQGPEAYGQVLQYALQDGKLVRVKEYRVGQFPHGLDIRDNVIVCTSMKDSSITFFPA